MIWKVLDNKKRGVLCTLLLGIGAGVFVFAFWGNGADAFPVLSNLANDVAVGFFEFIQAILASIVRLIGMTMFKIVGLLIIVGQYNGFINNEAVKTGWVIVRDVMNMFFVIVLLIIAISTILQQKNFAYQQMLPRLIVTALIINFSKTICGIFIDFSQVFMLTFFSAIFNASGANFAVLAGMPGLFAKGSAGACSDPSAAAAAGAAGKAFLALLWALVMIVIATIVILALLLMLIIRIITLWFLIILSPVAFFFLGIKDVQGIGKKWMDAFTQQVLFGPAVGFFLWLSLTVTQGVSSGEADVSKVSMTKVLGAKTAGEVERFEAQSGVDSDCGNTGSMETGGIASMIVGMGLLIGTLVVAQQTSNAAGGAVSKFAMSGIKDITGATKGAQMFKGFTDRQREKVLGGQSKAVDKLINAPRDAGNFIRRIRGKEEKPRIATRAAAESIDASEKAHKEQMDFRKKALKMGSQSPDELYKNREKAKGHDRTAYNQMIMERGLLGKDKDHEKDDEEIVKELEQSLKNLPESFREFENKLKEVAAHLAQTLDSFKDKNGNLNEGKMKAELQSGKLNADTFFSPWVSIDPNQLHKIAADPAKSPIRRAMAVMKLQQNGQLNDNDPVHQTLVSNATDGFKGVPKLQKEFMEGLAKTNSKLHFREAYTGTYKDADGNTKQKAEKFISELVVGKVTGKVLNADNIKSLETDLGGLDKLSEKLLTMPANKLQETLEDMPDAQGRARIVSAMDTITDHTTGERIIDKGGDGIKKAVAMGSGNFHIAYRGQETQFAEKLEHDDKLKASYIDSKNIDTLKNGQLSYHARAKGVKRDDKHLDAIRSNDVQKAALIEGLEAEMTHADSQGDSEGKMKAQIELVKLTRSSDKVNLTDINKILDGKFANAINLGDLRLVEKGAGGADYNRFVEILASKTREQLVEFAKVAKDKEKIMRDVVARLNAQGKGEFVQALQREGAV